MISSCTFDPRRVAFVQTDDVDPSGLSSIRFELVADKQTVRTIQYHITLLVVLNDIKDSEGTFCRVRFGVPGTHYILISNEVGCNLSDSAKR